MTKPYLNEPAPFFPSEAACLMISDSSMVLRFFLMEAVASWLSMPYLLVMNFRMACLEVFMLPSALLDWIASMIMSEYLG